MPSAVGWKPGFIGVLGRQSVGDSPKSKHESNTESIVNVEKPMSKLKSYTYVRTYVIKKQRPTYVRTCVCTYVIWATNVHKYVMKMVMQMMVVGSTMRMAATMIVHRLVGRLVPVSCQSGPCWFTDWSRLVTYGRTYVRT